MTAENKQYVVCLDRNIGHMDPVYGPFPSVDAAETWLEKRGFKDEPELYWEWYVLELEADLNPKFFDAQHFARD